MRTGAHSLQSSSEMTMLPHTFVEPQDDPAFLAVVDRIVAALVHRDQPADVFLVHIDNWFDHKWLRYSGTGIVDMAECYPFFDVALDGHSQEQLTFPPFAPSRVVAQYLFSKLTDGSYAEQAPPRLVHQRRRERSAKNLHRRVADFNRSGMFVWYSSGSALNRRGSLLVYSAREGMVDGWYAGFAERGGWFVDQVKGANRDAVTSLSTWNAPGQAGGAG
jgi:hypothetical protein